MSLKNKIISNAKKIRFVKPLWKGLQSLVFFIKHPFPKYNNKNRSGVIVQIVNSFRENDAIGNSIIEISNQLNAKNIENYVVYEASHFKRKNAIPIYNFKFNLNDLVIFHMGNGCHSSIIFKRINVRKKVLYYHNITPSKFFYDMPIAKKYSELGRKQLIDLSTCCDLAICDSGYNNEELKLLGYKKTIIMPIPNRINKLLVLKTSKIDDGIKKIITVGRISRNKCIEDVICVFNEYHKSVKNSVLYIIGKTENFKYENELKELVNKFKLNDSIFFVGPVSEKQLAYYYSNAFAYLCMSEHEGYCVPVVEALSFGVKVISKKNTALIETVGNFGVLVDKIDYKEIASLIDKKIRLKKYNYKNNNYDITEILNKL